MKFGESVRTCFSKYVTFTGRAARSEFWWWYLFTWLGNLILSMVDSVLFGTIARGPGSFEASTNTPILSGIFGLAVLLPTVAVSVRRLHDRDKSGWWLLLWLIPIIGWIILIIWFATEGTRGPNQFGEDPLNPGAGGDFGGEGLTASSIPTVPRD